MAVAVGRVIILLWVSILMFGCTSLYQGTARKLSDGSVIFKMSKPGNMTYKDKDIDASIDIRTPSILRGIIEGVALRETSNASR